jgi:hypothetical protein
LDNRHILINGSLRQQHQQTRVFGTRNDEDVILDGQNDLDDEDEYHEDDPDMDSLTSSFVELSSSTNSSTLQGLIPGSNEGFYIVKTYKTNPSRFNLQAVQNLIEENEFDRLGLTTQNISVPVALMVLDPDEYPSRSRARKACRKANILIHRGPLGIDEDSGEEIVFDAEKCMRARVGDRVFPGDVLAKQVRMGDGYFPVLGHKKPPFDLPVIFEDDHFAIGKQSSSILLNEGCGFGRLPDRVISLSSVLTLLKICSQQTSWSGSICTAKNWSWCHDSSCGSSLCSSASQTRDILDLASATTSTSIG